MSGHRCERNIISYDGGAASLYTGAYELTVCLPDAAPQQFAKLTCAPEFKMLNCVVIVSPANGPAVCYLDNVEFKPEKTN